jgi:hypothetical protein
MFLSMTSRWKCTPSDIQDHILSEFLATSQHFFHQMVDYTAQLVFLL